MMRGFISIAVLVIAGAILADLLAHPTPTKSLIDGLTNLWASAVQGASGAYAVQGK
jgi:hypothetical protein